MIHKFIWALLLAVFIAFCTFAIKWDMEADARKTPEQRELDRLGYEYVTIGGKRFLRNVNGNSRAYEQLTPYDRE